MNRLSAYPHWLVNNAPKDELPIAHSLTGFVTAFDFLQDRFDVHSQNRYLRKIRKEANGLHEKYIRHVRGWTRQHMHNHAHTVLLSMLLSSLVYEPVESALGENQNHTFD